MLSIVIPIYNVELYLKECLDSVVNQTYLDKEVILVNDGSTDKSKQIAQSYAEKYDYITLLNQKNEVLSSVRNTGAASARNTGAEAARGEYICFIDSDDYFPSHTTVEKMMNEVISSTADIVNFSWSIVYPNKVVNRLERRGLVTAKEAITMQLKNEISISACNKIYRRELIKAIQFKVGKTAEDQLFIYEVFERCHQIYNSDKICYAYRQRENSVTTSKLSLKNLDVLAIKEEIYQRAVSQYPELKKYESLYFSLSVINLKEKLNLEKNVEKSIKDTINSYFKRYFIKILLSNNIPIKTKITAILTQLKISKSKIRKVFYGR